MKRCILYMLSLLTAGSLISCDELLNALPSQSKVDGNVIVDQKSAEVALNGVYSRFAEVGDDRGTASTMWGGTHEITPANLAGFITYSNGGSEFDGAEEMSADSRNVKGMWFGFYQLVNAANGVIKQMAPLAAEMFEGDRKAEILAEARYLRAYGHYNLLRYFAQFYDLESDYGVLLRKEFVTTDNIAQKRSSVKATYDFILEDVEEAVLHAPLENKNIYVNRWIAKGLKARVLMMRGRTVDFETAAGLAKDIIEHGPYQLEEDVSDIFKTKGLESREVMLGVQPLPNQVKRHDDYLYNNRASYKATMAFKELLKNDPRKEKLIGLLNPGDTIYAVTKYAGPQEEVCYAMRLTEIYLLQAEAIARAGGDIGEAKRLLKTVMGHAGITDFTGIDATTDPDDLLFEIYKETAKNLMFEDGIEWSAFIRFPIEKILEVKPAILAKEYIILPIPAAEFDKNPTIGAQNPGYSKN